MFGGSKDTGKASHLCAVLHESEKKNSHMFLTTCFICLSNNKNKMGRFMFIKN